jgi:hypothetical protein
MAEEEAERKAAKKQKGKKGGTKQGEEAGGDSARDSSYLGSLAGAVTGLVQDSLDNMAGVGDDFDEEAGRGGTGSEVIPVDMSDETLAWPRFVPVIRLLRKRALSDCCSWADKNKQAFYTVKYQQEVAECEVKREHVVTSPLEVHEKLCVRYQRQLMRGWPHAKIMNQFSDVRCGLVVLWKRGRKFTGGYSEAKLKFAWMMNIALLLTIIALLLWDILSYYGEIPFGSVLVSMVIADVLGLASALFLPLLAKTVLRVLYERSERREKAKIAEAERLSDTRRFVVPGAEPLPSAQPDAKPGQHMVGMLAASKNPTSMFPFIEAALRDLAERHEVDRNLPQRMQLAAKYIRFLPIIGLLPTLRWRRTKRN